MGRFSSADLYSPGFAERHNQELPAATGTGELDIPSTRKLASGGSPHWLPSLLLCSGPLLRPWTADRLKLGKRFTSQFSGGTLTAALIRVRFIQERGPCRVKINFEWRCSSVWGSLPLPSTASPQKIRRSPVPQRLTPEDGAMLREWFTKGRCSIGSRNLTDLPMSVSFMIGRSAGWRRRKTWPRVRPTGFQPLKVT